MPLNLKLHHRTILSRHLQINMIVVLSLDSFLGFLVGHGERRSLLSCRFTKEAPGPHWGSAQAAPGAAGSLYFLCGWHWRMLLIIQKVMIIILMLSQISPVCKTPTLGQWYLLQDNSNTETDRCKKQEVYFLVRWDRPSISLSRRVTRRWLWTATAVFILFKGTGYIRKVTVQTYWLTILTFKSIG